MRKSKSFIGFMLKHADGIDLFLMSLGFIGAVGDGVSTPVLLFVTSMFMNNIGGGPTSSDPTLFLHNINKVAAILLYASCGFWVACFLEGYCWARTGERQATRMRSKYLKAVLRQDVGYFDTRETSTTEVITSVSNDTLVIQDTISEKVPNFLMNIAMFVGGNIFALAMLWKLALIAFPFVLLLIIPGFMYGRILMDLSRKNIKEYNTAGIIAEQAIASIRTVYSFVGETNTLKEFSEALEGTVKLGIKQGLARGLAIGSNGLVFGIWAFMFWYGSKMVMYHGARGGTVYAVGCLVAVAGQALGSALSNMKSFTEACSAGEHIMEIIQRVPKIDSNSAEGEILQQISGTVEFKGIKFAYPSRPSNIIFENICLTIPAGKTMALVGASGSGKSTIISLLQRFYDPISGEILLDGVAINKLQLHWLRAQMGLVNQEPSLFATSIKENVLFGKEDATMEEIIEAAKLANAHNFISQLPQGYNTQVRTLVGDRMALLVQTMSAMIISCTMGLIIAWKLAIVMIAAQPLIVACLYARRVLLKNMSKKSIKAQEESCKLAAEAVSNIRTVTSFSSHARILEMFSQAQEGPKKESKTQSWFAGIGMGTCRSVLSCSWTLSFWYGGKLVSDGSISAKALFETFLVLISTGRVIAEVATMTTDLARGVDAVSSVFAILDRPSRIKPDDPKGIKPIRLKGQVDFCDVHFVYPTRPNVTIFNGLALSIDEGKSTALVGPSGSGKSTIIGLIERFYEPLNGSIIIDGVDLRLYHLRCLRQHIGLVNQEPTLFSGTIRENIAYGAPDEVNESEISKAAMAANAHDFITQLKDGYDTRCGDRGLQLSGGQKQRIAIARAMLKNPGLLLLDEATSALDGQAERVVQDALERVMVGRTSVVVAHRLSTIQNCDLILVLDKGVVVEKGTHKSLLEKGSEGAYYSLVSLQQGPLPSNV